MRPLLVRAIKREKLACRKCPQGGFAWKWGTLPIPGHDRCLESSCHSGKQLVSREANSFRKWWGPDKSGLPGFDATPFEGGLEDPSSSLTLPKFSRVFGLSGIELIRGG
jgi:hypothetical protein